MTTVTLSAKRSPSSFAELRPFSPEELQALWVAVSSVPDPELGGVTIGELGLVYNVCQSSDDAAIEVTLLPTFLGCPALKLMERDVEAVLRAHSIAGDISVVRVTWVNSPAWNPSRISESGRAKLAELGIAVPGSGPASVDGGLPVCPICSVASLEAKLPVGPTACRSVAWCRSCRSVVEIMRGSQTDVAGDSYAYL
jgi:ring-1,2-phenylacetyl-CoA epoxidase subunit PaaD